jgi:broad specificity phosphatase PhoE
MESWIAEYNLAEIITEQIPEAAGAVCHKAQVVLCSSSPRACSSAAALRCTPDRIDDLFLEAQLPTVKWRWPKLSPYYWTALFRMAWFAGYSKDVESCRHAQKRAMAAANVLLQYTVQGDVLLIAHGMINRFIARELAKNGWQKVGQTTSSCWGVLTLDQL